MLMFHLSLIKQRQKHLLFLTILMLTGLLLNGCGERYEFNGTELTEGTVAYDIVGLDTDNASFRLSDHQGKYVLVNFGYTFCPDVCPLTLADLSNAYTQLLTQEGISSDDIVVVFVTVDPERDTPDKLGVYVDVFHADFYGVYINNEAELQSVLDAYAIQVSRRYRPGNNDTVTYFVDHTAGIYVIDPEGVEQLYFPYDIGADKILADMAYLIAQN